MREIQHHFSNLEKKKSTNLVLLSTIYIHSSTGTENKDIFDSETFEDLLPPYLKRMLKGNS